MRTIIGLLVLVGIAALILQVLKIIAGFILLGIGGVCLVVALILYLVHRAKE